MEALELYLWWMTTPRGRMVCGLLLFVVVGAIERAPGVGRYLVGKPHLKRALAGTLAAAAALGTALLTDLPGSQLAEVAAIAFVTGAGLNATVGGLVKRLFPAPSATRVVDLQTGRDAR